MLLPFTCPQRSSRTSQMRLCPISALLYQRRRQVGAAATRCYSHTLTVGLCLPSATSPRCIWAKTPLPLYLHCIGFLWSNGSPCRKSGAGEVSQKIHIKKPPLMSFLVLGQSWRMLSTATSRGIGSKPKMMAVGLSVVKLGKTGSSGTGWASAALLKNWLRACHILLSRLLLPEEKLHQIWVPLLALWVPLQCFVLVAALCKAYNTGATAGLKLLPHCRQASSSRQRFSHHAVPAFRRPTW
mmetsp:Transcript_37522/g.67909  ORF Transcript_37522/g.67909 Transcript_37522/m.67909 type:complete len:241 (-) Transcript_37522:337-1059(-)